MTIEEFKTNTIVFLIVIMGVMFIIGMALIRQKKEAELALVEKKFEKIEEMSRNILAIMDRKNQPQTIAIEPNTTTLNLSSFPAEEIKIITAAAKRNNLRTELYPVLFAIRKAENGRAGREFGVLHPRAVDTNLDTQAGWAAATVQKNYDRWVSAGKQGIYIDFLGNRYCPVGANNDPNGLNQHWIGNVEKWVETIQGK